MNYIYDILLNYGSVAYDFFEWNNSDNILHIRKIPLIKVNPITLIDIRDYDVEFSKDFLESINKKTEIFNHKNIRVIEEACLLSDGANIIAIMIKNNHLLKSKLLIDEEEEVLSICQKIKEKNINYKKIKNKKSNIFITRKEADDNKKLREELNRIFSEKNNETIKYIYYECFDKKEENIKNIRHQLINLLTNEEETIIKKLKKVLELLEIKYKIE